MIEKLYSERRIRKMDEENMVNVGMRLTDTINNVIDRFNEAEEGSKQPKTRY